MVFHLLSWRKVSTILSSLFFALVIFNSNHVNASSSAAAAAAAAAAKFDDKENAVNPLPKPAFVPDIPPKTLKELGADREIFKNGTYVVLDVESTGVQTTKSGAYLGPETNRVIQLCMYLFVDGEFQKAWNGYFKSPSTVSKVAYGIHGLKDSFLQEQETFLDTYAEIAAFMAEADVSDGKSETNEVVLNIVGHNVGADISLLFKNEMERALRELKDDTIYVIRRLDTLSMARRDARRLETGQVIPSPARQVDRIRALKTPERAERAAEQSKARADRRRLKVNREFRQDQEAGARIRALTRPEVRAERAEHRRQHREEGVLKRKINFDDDDDAWQQAAAEVAASDAPVAKKARGVPADFKLETLANHYLGTENATEAAIVSMLLDGLDAEEVQKRLGVPLDRIMKAHEAVTDVMMTRGVVFALSDDDGAASDDNSPLASPAGSKHGVPAA